MEQNRRNIKAKRNRFLIALLALAAVTSLNAQTTELLPFGDFESWVTRNIKESGLLGGDTKTIYNIGPTDTINGSQKYDYSKSIWCSSNTMANLVGIVKTSMSVRPEKYEKGTCARLETVLEKCKVLGIINVKALTAGSILWGDAIEPLTSISNPYSFYNWGIPFSKRPKAIVVDVKAHINPEGIITHINGTSVSTTKGEDPAEVRLLLQNRTEDADGNITAKRVATADYLIYKSTDGWQTDLRIPVIYGDARKSENYIPRMDLMTENHNYARNSKGEMVKIIETGWADPDLEITHAILLIGSGSQPTFSGALGNILWIDNIRFEY